MTMRTRTTGISNQKALRRTVKAAKRSTIPNNKTTKLLFI